jgi:hypothetical protein
MEVCIPCNCFSAIDMHRIAAACTNLQYLCLNLYELDIDRDESDILGPRPGADFVPSEFEQALIAIASIPTLRDLCLTNPPSYRESLTPAGGLQTWFRKSLRKGKQQYDFQTRADGLVGFLGANGSNLESLAFCPTEPLRAASEPDEHGHIWPEYEYVCYPFVNHKGIRTMIARPALD